MTTYQELIAQKKLLDQQINEARKLESKAALATVMELVREFGFTAQQVFPWKPAKAHVPSKYLDPNSGATWTGRGKPPAWIAGKDREQFLIQQAPEPRQDGPYLAEMAADAASRRAR